MVLEPTYVPLALLDAETKLHPGPLLLHDNIVQYVDNH